MIWTGSSMLQNTTQAHMETPWTGLTLPNMGKCMCYTCHTFCNFYLLESTSKIFTLSVVSSEHFFECWLHHVQSEQRSALIELGWQVLFTSTMQNQILWIELALQTVLSKTIIWTTFWEISDRPQCIGSGNGNGNGDGKANVNVNANVESMPTLRCSTE